MNYVRLSPEQQQAVCEDLLTIEQAGMISRLAAVRQQMLRDHRPADHWQQLAIDHLTKRASSLIGGSRGYWREAAAAALGIESAADTSIKAVCRVAADVRGEEASEPPQDVPRARLSVGGRKRGRGR